VKQSSLFNEGMKPTVYSVKKKEDKNIGWIKDGNNISYYQNSISKEACSGLFLHYFTLTFTYRFDYNDDTVFFSYTYPYTYSDLNDYLDNLMSDQVKN